MNATSAEAKSPDPIVCSEEGCTSTAFERVERWDETQRHTVSTAPGRYDTHEWEGLDGDLLDSSPWTCVESTHEQSDENEDLLRERA